MKKVYKITLQTLDGESQRVIFIEVRSAWKAVEQSQKLKKEEEEIYPKKDWTVTDIRRID